MGLKHFTLLLTIAVSFVLIFSVSDGYAQGLRINEKPGGSGSTSSSQSNSDNSFIYIVGGAVIAGIVVYALLNDTSEKKKDKDTTSAVDSEKLLVNSAVTITNKNNKFLQAKDELPVDLFFGIRNDEGIFRNKTYLVGVKVKL